MDVFFKICAGALVALVLSLTIAHQEKNLNLLMIMAACCMVVAAAVGFLQPVMEFASRVISASGLQEELILIVFKAVGIGLVSEITCMICSDGGNAALAKVIQILSSAVILWIGIPLFEKLLDTMEDILGAI